MSFITLKIQICPCPHADKNKFQGFHGAWKVIELTVIKLGFNILYFIMIVHSTFQYIFCQFWVKMFSKFLHCIIFALQHPYFPCLLNGMDTKLSEILLNFEWFWIFLYTVSYQEVLLWSLSCFTWNYFFTSENKVQKDWLKINVRFYKIQKPEFILTVSSTEHYCFTGDRWKHVQHVWLYSCHSYVLKTCQIFKNAFYTNWDW